MPSRLAELFGRAGSPTQIVALRTGDAAMAAARSAVAGGAEVVVAAGGDGTVNCVAQAVVGSRTALGVLPIGTLNHFAKDLGIPLALERAVDTIINGRPVRIDAAAVNDYIFVNNSSIGIYPDIVAERERIRQRGYRKWTAFALATASLLRQYRGVQARLTVGSSTESFRTPFLFVGNNEYKVEGIRLGARERLDTGQLFVYLAPRVRGQELLKLVALALIGRATANPALESFTAPQLEIETPASRRLRVAVDGEVILMTTPLRYRTLPGALSVIVPSAR